MVSLAFSRSKNIAVRCSFLMKASLMFDFRCIRWSIVPLLLRNPHCKLDISLFDSKYHVNLLFIILSIVLHKQLVKEIGLVLWI